jgi:hypothetical protein
VTSGGDLTNPAAAAFGVKADKRSPNDRNRRYCRRRPVPLVAPEHDALLARCREAGQTRPTPLILRYGVGEPLSG